MLSRGRFDLLALLIINPILILCFQNCSLSSGPEASASVTSAVTRPHAARDPASVSAAQEMDPPSLAECQGHGAACLIPTID